MLQIGNNVIINADDADEIAEAEKTDFVAITCGLKLNSTITASSIDDDGFTFCLQRAVYTLRNNKISPQEFNVKWHKKPDDIFIYLAIVTTLILCDVDLDTFKSVRF